MKKAKIKTIMLLLICSFMMAILTQALTVTLNGPADNAWETSSSVNHNITASGEVTTYEWCAIYTNKTGSFIADANYTNIVTNGTPFVRGLAYDDVSVVWNAQCYNGSDAVFSAANYTLNVDSTVPSITLNSPADNAYLDSDTDDLKYTPTDASNPGTCLLYTNISGSWAINQTNASYVSGTQIKMNLSSVADGVYIWNAVCNDSAGNIVDAEDTNRTFTVDTVNPTDIKFVSPTNNTVSNDTTPTIKWNATTDVNFQKYTLSIATDVDFTNIIKTVDVTTNATTIDDPNILETNDQYYMIVTAYDLASNAVNTTSVLYYAIDSTAPSITLNSPANGSYSNDNTPDFNVTVVDDNPDSCVLYLSNSSGQNTVANITVTGVTNGTKFNMTPSTMTDGTYKFNVMCNDTFGAKTNVSSTLLDLTIDTTAPTAPELQITWSGTNSTDATPNIIWKATTETNFDKYVIEAYYLNSSLASQANVSTKAQVSYNLTVNSGFSYTFNVTAYDLAGNKAEDGNTTAQSLTYVDSICGTLESGWNLCGIVSTTARNLSVIGAETSASFVSVWNTSNHAWATCNVGVSTQNCDLDVQVTTGGTMHVWVYVTATTLWEDRTWSATQASANITLSNVTNGWNIMGGIFRNGRNFGDLGRSFTGDNVSLFSHPYNNGSNNVPFVNIAGWNSINNETLLDYGEAQWVYYNTTGSTEFDVGGW